jgi:hypothetical protein
LRVILAAVPGEAFARELLLALAARGHSFVLWLAPSRQQPATDAVLDLQLEIARAGGISLVHEEESLGAAAEAFGRIDLALAGTEAEATRMVRALAGLERDRRPGRLLLLYAEGTPEGIQPMASRDLPAIAAPSGVKLYLIGALGRSAASLAEAIGAWV